MDETNTNVLEQSQNQEQQQPLQASRAKLDFPAPQQVEDSQLTDIERQLRQLDSEMDSSVQEPASQPDEQGQQKPEQQKPDNNLPSLDELDLQPKQQEPVQQVNQQLEELVGKIEDPNMKALVDYFKNEVTTMQQELQQYRSQRAQEDLKTALSKEWGVAGDEFNTRLNAVVERYNQYPPELQQRLDNLEGAKLIWAKLEQEQNQKQSSVPNFQKSKPSGSGKQDRMMFRQSDIIRMSPAEYERNASRILYAYQKGLVQQDN